MSKFDVSAVLFDLGSTLIEYEPIPWDEMIPQCYASTREFLIKQGYTVPDFLQFQEQFNAAKRPFRDRAANEWIEWTVPQAIEQLMTTLDIRLTPTQHEQFFEAYYEPIGPRLFAYEDTLAMLERITRRYGKPGLISNTIFPEHVHRGEIDRFGIASHLNFAIFSSTFQLRKPHPDIFREGARLAGQPPERCLYIGDRYLEDITGPRSIGMNAILKTVPNRDYPDPLPGDLCTISTLSELADHLDI